MFITALTQTSVVHGILLDTENHPLEFVNVILFKSSDSSIYKTDVSTHEGKFEFSGVRSGEYFLKTNFIGLEDYDSGRIVLVSGSDFDAGVIPLSRDANLTKTVDVVFKKPLVVVESDKTIFNVEGTINSAALDAMELLRRAPGVMLDNDDNISIKGRSGILIYIDGKRTPLDGDGLKALLKNMQSSNIDRIEIITSPSAKYDAAGTAGIINIILKKNQNFGTNGSIQLGYAVQIYSKYNGSITLNHRNEKWNFFGNYGYNQNEKWNWMNLDRFQYNTNDSLSYLYSQKTNTYGTNQSHNYKAGADYFINNKNSIGVMVNGNYSDETGRGTSYTNISVEGENVSRTLEASTISTTLRSNFTGNLNYHFTNRLSKDLNVDADYGVYAITTATFQPNTYSYNDVSVPMSNINYRFNTPVDISIASLKSDYEQNLLGGKFTTGFKLSYVQTENTLNRFNVFAESEVLDSLLSNSFEYHERINAGYLHYKKKSGRFDVQAGVRAEQTTSKGTLTSFTTLSNEADRNVDRNYLNFFPSAGITYSKNDTNQYALTFSKRIDRPSYQDLNPFESKLDELTYVRGNPFLQPQYGHLAEFTYTYLYSFNASLAYSYTKDFFAHVTDTANGNASFIMKRNLGFEEWIGINISSPIKLGKKINAFTNFNGGRKHIQSSYSNIDVMVWSYRFFGQLTYLISPTFSTEISGWYSGPGVWGATFVVKPMGSIDIAMKKEIWKGQASLRIALSDILYSNQWRSASNIPQIKINGNGGWESRQLRLSFTYHFGNQKIGSKPRKTGADDLKDRVN